MLKDVLKPETFTKDFMASIVVVLVALPLCMGIAIASGLPPAAGIITGIVGGIVAGALGGCQLQVSGPAAGLVVVVSDLLQEYGPYKIGLLVLLAGFIQFNVGCFRMAQWFRAVPPSVINGMLSGIGILILGSQFHVMIDDAPKGSGIDNLLSIPAGIMKAVTPNSSTSHQEAATIGILTITVMLLWQKMAPGKLKLVPSTLVAVLAATGLAMFWHAPVRYVNLPTNLLEAVKLPTWQSCSFLLHGEIILDAIAIALIASAETLLTAAALDKMHRGPRTNYDKELRAQGIGNMICGFLGAPPMTGVMVRSGVNVTAGAKTRLSTIMHGFWLLLFVTGLPFIIRLIPTASLAALLVFTGWKLANFKVSKELWLIDRGEAAIYAVTVATIVATDLLTGVVTGVVLALAKLLYRFTHLEIKSVYDPATNRTDLWFRGVATFLNLPKFSDALEAVNPGTELHIHMDALDHIDHACLDALMSWDKQHQETGGVLVIDWDGLAAMFKDRRKKDREGDDGRTTKQFRRVETAEKS
jgi:MFS superfamily sulfate permease-like transporter